MENRTKIFQCDTEEHIHFLDAANGIIRGETLTHDVVWEMWKKAVTNRNNERKNYFEKREEILSEYGNKSIETTNPIDLKKLILDVKRYRDIINRTKYWNKKELVCYDNLGNELYLENYETRSYTERVYEVECLIDTIQSRIDYYQINNEPPRQPETKRFETRLTDAERLELCNTIIVNKGAESKTNKPILKDFTQKHIPTLLYILGGEYPKKIEKIRVYSIGRAKAFLKSISAHPHPYTENEICVPDFLKHALLDTNGNDIDKLK